MKITKRQLKRIIKEEYRRLIQENAAPEDLYNRMLELQEKHSSEINTVNRIGLDGYSEIIKLRDEMREQDPSHDNYGNFQQQVKSKIMAGLAYKMWFEQYQTFLSGEELAPLVDEYNDLKEQFRRVETTDAVDRRYGRKRHAMEHIPTGKRFSLGTNRRGSLGS